MPHRIVHSSATKTKQVARRKIKTNHRQQEKSISGLTGSSRGSQTKTLPMDRQSSQRRSPNLLISLVLYLLRIGIMGVGIGAIAGTTLAIFNPADFLAAYFKSAPLSSPSEESATSPDPQLTTPQDSQIKTTKSLTDLQAKLQTIEAKYPNIKPQAWFMDLDNGAYVSLNGTTAIPAASTIKIPILVAFFEEVDAGNIQLEQMLTMDKEVIASGSGDMQYMAVNKQFTALEVATKMIVISDNTATNMLIRQIGGKDILNERFKQWGLTQTIINNLLPDLEGTNKTSSEDLSKLLARVERGDLISLRSRDRLLAIMEGTRTRTLLPQGLEKEANIAHKTGDIGTIIGDAGIIDMPSGKRYIGAVFAERAYNDPAGRSLIQDFSRTVYQHFKYYQPRPVPKPLDKKPTQPSDASASGS